MSSAVSIRKPRWVCTSAAKSSLKPTSCLRRCKRFRGHLYRFAPDAFDYIVVDEFHHAAAATYRKVLDHFMPRFLLGLTATPERMDGADLLSLCADNLVFECDLVEGIRRDELVPFHYWGVPIRLTSNRSHGATADSTP